jgi:hypothetical protein
MCRDHLKYHMMKYEVQYAVMLRCKLLYIMLHLWCFSLLSYIKFSFYVSIQFILNFLDCDPPPLLHC